MGREDALCNLIPGKAAPQPSHTNSTEARLCYEKQRRLRSPVVGQLSNLGATDPINLI